MVMIALVFMKSDFGDRASTLVGVRCVRTRVYATGFNVSCRVVSCRVGTCNVTIEISVQNVAECRDNPFRVVLRRYVLIRYVTIRYVTCWS